MTIPRPVVFLKGPEDDAPNEPAMKFRLTYEGELRPTGNDPVPGQSNPLASHKHQIRKEFHRQLRELWRTDRFLSSHRVWPKDWLDKSAAADGAWARLAPSPNEMIPLLDAAAGLFPMFGYRFVPLVQERFLLACSLDILFLRRDLPGSVLTAGDIDNRIKTVIDCLRLPRNQTELVGPDATPGPDDDPFFCLLEDDKQVTHFAVETDTLLDPKTNEGTDLRRAKLVITVSLRPYYVTQFNLSFA